MGFELLKEKIALRQNPSVMGLDISPDFIPDERKTGDIGADLTKYCADLIDATADIIPAVKPNCAFFECYGLPGLAALEKVTVYAKNAGLAVILDGKRGDIGNTCRAYAKAYLTEGEGKPDYLTVNPYMGSESVFPFAEEAEKTGKGIFVLARTSNPSASDFEDIKDEGGEPLYLRVADKINEWGGIYSGIGAVCGATHPKELALLRERMPDTFFLIPGYGAQGGGAKDALPGFDKNGENAIVNSSRGIIAAWKKTGGNHKDAARAAALKMKEEFAEMLK